MNLFRIWEKTKFLHSCLAVCLILLLTCPQLALAGRLVRVGIYPMPGYHEMDAAGNLDGYGYKFLEKIKRYNDWQYEFISYKGGYIDALKALQDGKVDIVTGSTKTPERQKLFGFSDKPIALSKTVLTARTGDVRFLQATPEAYQGKKVGMCLGSACNQEFEKYAQEHSFSYVPVYYPDLELLGQALQDGEIDLLVAREQRVRKNEMILEAFAPRDTYLLTRLEDKELLAEADYGIAMLSMDLPNWRSDLNNEFFRASANDNLYFTEAEQQYLKELADSGKVLKVLFECKHVPFAYWEDGRLQGANAEYFDRLAKKLGIKYEVVEINGVDDYVDVLSNHKADIIMGSPIDYAAATRLGYVITEPFIRLPVGMVRAADTKEIHTVAMNRNSILSRLQQKYLAEHDYEVRYYDTAKGCIRAVKDKECDGAIINLYDAQLAVAMDRGSLVALPISGSLPLTIAVNAEANRNLVTILDKALSNDDSYQLLLTNYFQINVQDKSLLAHIYDHPLLAGAIMLLLLACVGMLLYSYHKNGIARLVSEQNTSLTELNHELQTSYAEQQAQNERLLQLNSQLREKEKAFEEISHAKANFLLNISHDIRMSMNDIIGFTTLMEQKLQDPKGLKEYIDKVRCAGNYPLRLINDVLDLVRMESGQLILDESYYNLERDGSAISLAFEEQIGQKRLQAAFTMNVTHKDIYCDGPKLEQIWFHLIANAVKYTPPGGSIRVHTEELPHRKPGWATYRCTVEDTGIGISEEYLPRIFDAFSRERNTAECRIAGTGLGMPIVKRLVDMMQGTIQIESQLGVGTKVTVIISHRLASPHAEAANVQVADCANPTGEQILLSASQENCK